jgi:hypothetical protein
MPEILDIFNNDAFSVITLTDKINKQELTPGRLGELGLFSVKRITTTAVGLELQEQTLKLVDNKARGGVPQPNDAAPRKLLSLKVPHLPVYDEMLADEVQNVRTFGVGDEAAGQIMAVQTKAVEKLDHMRRKIEVTIEYHRVGALKGVILDANGTTVIYNLFTQFDVTQQSMTLILDTAGTDVPARIRAAVRLLEAALGSTVYTRLHAIVGSSLMDKLIAHASLKELMKANQIDARLLREDDLRYGALRIGNVVFEEYRGSVGGVPFIAANEGYLFAEGVPDLFVTYFGPADYIETVNTLGLPFYAKQETKRMGKGIDLEAQSNPLSICTRPASVIKLIENT